MTDGLGAHIFTEFGAFNDYLCFSRFHISQTSLNVQKALLGDNPAMTSFDEATIHLAVAEIGATGHESKHLIDMFGTALGLSLIFGFFEQVDRFLKASTEMRRQGGSWRVPVPVRSRNRDGSWGGSELLAVRAIVLLRQQLETPFHPLSVDRKFGGLVSTAAIGAPGLGTSRWTVVRRGILRGSDGTTIPFSVALPLGLTAFLEGSARVLEKRYLRTLGFAEVTLRALSPRTAALPAVRQPVTVDEVLKSITPYETTEHAICAILNRRGMTLSDLLPETFLKIHDGVMMEAELVQQEHGDLGILATVPDLSEILDNLVMRLSDDEITRGDVPQSNLGLERSIAWGRKIFEIAKASACIPDNPTRLALFEWRRYLARRYAAKLLALRLANIHPPGGFDHFIESAKAVLPACAVYVDGVGISINLPDPMKEHFLAMVMLFEIMRQIFETPGDVRCPRASGVLPSGLSTLNFARDGSCDRWRLLGCGRFSQGKRAICMPDCLFESTLEDCAFRREAGSPID